MYNLNFQKCYWFISISHKKRKQKLLKIPLQIWNDSKIKACLFFFASTLISCFFFQLATFNFLFSYYPLAFLSSSFSRSCCLISMFYPCPSSLHASSILWNCITLIILEFLALSPFAAIYYYVHPYFYIFWFKLTTKNLRKYRHLFAAISLVCISPW